MLDYLKRAVTAAALFSTIAALTVYALQGFLWALEWANGSWRAVPLVTAGFTFVGVGGLCALSAVTRLVDGGLR